MGSYGFINIRNSIILIFSPPPPPSTPLPKQKSQESNRTSPIYLICTEIQAYGYMSHYGQLVNQMKDFSIMQTSEEEEESPDIR